MSARPAFEAVHLSEVEEVAAAGSLRWLPLRRRLGVAAFGVNGYRAARAGDELIEPHDELGGGAGQHEELYLVVSGHATFTVDGQAVDAPAGTLVFVRDPATRRHAVAAADHTVAVVVGGAAGHPYEVSAWEFSFAAEGPARAGRLPEAIAIMREGLALHPANGSLLYNAACFEALAGQHDEALAHLQRALEVAPDDVLRWAQGDADLDPIRDDPRFPRVAPGT